MNRKFILCSILIPLFLPGLLTFFSEVVFAQERPQEEVRVTLIEVPVRVLFKGQNVKDLTKDDLELYENGVRQEIKVFEAKTRKISAPRAAVEEMAVQPAKRLFVLIFNIFDYSDAVGEGIDSFFQNIFRPGDQLVVLIEDRILNIETGKGVSEVVSALKESLKRLKLISNQATLKVFRELSIEADRLLNILRGLDQDRTPIDQAVTRFFDNYLRFWDEYKRHYLIPDVELYRGIAKRIQQIDAEKWAICLQQRELFPKLKQASSLDREISNWVEAQTDPRDQVRARMVQAKQMELKRNMDVSGIVPSEILRDIFMKANITFHLITLKSFRTLLSQDFELDDVAQDYEDCFKKISRATGGYSTFSNNISEALKEATESEDHYYLLAYSPKEDEKVKERKVEVKVKKSDVDIIYLKQVALKEAPPITILNFQPGKQSIKFTLVNYGMTRVQGKLSGIAEVRISLFDKDSKQVFDEGKTLTIFNKETHISLNLNQLRPGQYFIIIQAIDKVNQEVDVYSGVINL